MTKGHKVQRVGYIRVSTLDQSTERQLDGMELDHTFKDKASGKDTDRPQLQAALKHVRVGDTLVVHSLDRLARNAEDLLRTVRELTERGVTVEFVKDRLTFRGGSDGADAQGTLMLTILAAIAGFERALIRERQREGIALAKKKGVYSRTRRKKLAPEQVAELVTLARDGMPKAELARDYGISRETLYQYLRAGKAQPTIGGGEPG
jgi:DNA invertase Pin-like site-specific DNA recombinase